MPKSYTVAARYGIAVAAVAGALLVSLLLRSVMGTSYVLVFLVASVVTARYGGTGPGVLAIILSACAIYFFLLRSGESLLLDPDSTLLLVIFTGAALAVNSMYVSLRSAKTALDGQRHKVQAAEARLRTLLANMPVLLSVRGSQNLQLTWNKESERVTGYRADEIAAHSSLLEALYPDPQDRARIVEFLGTHKGNYRNWEVTVTRKDGEQRIISWSSASKQFPIEGWEDWAIGIDVTQWRRTEQRLRLLQSIAAALVEAVTPEDVADAVVSRAYEVLGVGTGTIYRLLPDGDTLELLRERHLDAEVADKYRVIPVSMSGPLTDAIRSREPVFISTFDEYVERYPEVAEYVRRNRSAATAGIPLIAQNTLLGGLSLSFPKPTPMTDEFKALLLAVAHQCAQALHRALLFAEERQARERLRVTLTSIGDAVIATDASGNVIFVNPVAEQLTGWRAEDAVGEPLKQVFHIVNEESRAVVESPYDKVIQTGATVGLANHTVLLARDGRETPIDDSGAPIHDDDGAISGVIIVFRDITERRRDEQRMLALLRVTSLFVKAVTVQDVADVVVKQVLPLLLAQRGMLAMLNENEDGLNIIGQYNVSLQNLTSFQTISLNAKIASMDALRTGESVWIERASDHLAQYPDSPVLNPAEMRVQSAIAVPFELESGKRVVLSAGFTTPQIFDEATRDFITAITRQCAQALDRALFYESERAARERLAFLAEAGAMLVSSLDYDTTLKHITRLAVPRVADWCAMDILDGDGSVRQLRVAHTDEAKEELVSRFREQRLKNPQDLAGTIELIRQGKTQVFNNITPEMIEQSEADEEAKRLLLQLDLKAAMYVPLFAHGHPLGLLSFGSSESGRSFSQDDVRLAEELAHRAAVAIENSRLYVEAQQQSERLRVTLTSIGDAVIATDAGGEIIFINAVAERLSGWNADEANGRRLNEVFHIVSEETGEIAPSPYEKVMQTGAIVGLANHTLLITRDGRRIPIDDSGAPIHDESGTIIGVIIVFRDITERRRDEIRSAALHRLTAAFSEAATVDEIANLVVTQGVDALEAHMGVIMHLNEDSTALQPLAHYNFQPQALANFASVPLDKAFATTEVVRTGQPIWLETVEEFAASYPDVVELRDEGIQAGAVVPLMTQSVVTGVINLFFKEPHVFDTGERNFIVALAQQCAQAIDRALLYEAEQEARRKAEEANELKMRFLGMISHELRTPLTSIKGFATTLLATDVSFDPDQQHRFIEVIDQEADKLTELIDQLLDLTRLQSNTLTINPVRNTLQSVIEVAAAQLETITREHQLRLDLPRELPEVEVDANRIAQVLVNLVGNAAKFSPTNTEIIIEARRAGEYVQVRVCDHGPGIPPDAHEYVFEAFRQVENSGMPRKGAGLGLAISRALIEGHGGRIWIESGGQNGTAIAFTLPTVDLA